MTLREIEEALCQETAVILAREATTLSPETPLRDLGMDSMGFVELLLFIERTFQLRLIETGLAREDFETLRTVARRIEKEINRSSWGSESLGVRPGGT